MPVDLTQSVFLGACAAVADARFAVCVDPSSISDIPGEPQVRLPLIFNESYCTSVETYESELYLLVNVSTPA